MSAYIMSDEGFNQLADELASHAENSTRTCDTRYMFAATIREFLHFDASCFSSPDDAYPEASVKAQELYAANVTAVNQRYEDEQKAADLRFVRRSHFVQWSPVQLIKHLQCLRYQMSEGDVPETPLYKALSQLIADLCENVVSGSSEYNQANWDFVERKAVA